MAKKNILRITSIDLAEASLDVIDENLSNVTDPKEKIELLKEKNTVILSQIFPNLKENPNETRYYNKILEDTAKELIKLWENKEGIYTLGLKYYFEKDYEKAEEYFFQSIKNWIKNAIHYWVICIRNIILSDKKDFNRIVEISEKISELIYATPEFLDILRDFIKILLETKDPTLINFALDIVFNLIDSWFNAFYLDLAEIYIFILKSNMKLEWWHSKEILFKETSKILDDLLSNKFWNEVLLSKIYELYWDLYLAYKPESKADKELAKDYYYEAFKELDKVNVFESKNSSLIKIFENLVLKILEIEDSPEERIVLLQGLTT